MSLGSGLSHPPGHKTRQACAKEQHRAGFRDGSGSQVPPNDVEPLKVQGTDLSEFAWCKGGIHDSQTKVILPVTGLTPVSKSNAGGE